MGTTRKRVAGFLCGIGILAALVGSAAANTTTGNQNPQLRVTAALTPNAAKTGSKFHAVVTVTNTTSRTRQVSITYEFDGPTSGMGTAMSPIPIKPHATWTHTFSPRAGSAGKYKLIMQAKDAAGTSKTTATASAS